MAAAIRLAVLAAVLASTPSTGQANIYECVADDGMRTFSDQPCPNAMKSPYECEPVPGMARTFDSSACRDVLGEEGRSPQRQLIVSQPRSAAIAATPRPVAQPQIGDQIVASLVSQIMNMLGQLWWLVALLLLLALARIPVIKGWLGEQLVRIALAFGLPKSDYQVFYDVTVRGSDGTTQIDHLVVSRFGVFVIETKSMKGWIFGQAQDAQWTQQNFRHKSQFQNPLRQNHRHIAVLKEILQLPEEHFRGLVGSWSSSAPPISREADLPVFADSLA